MDKEQIEQAIIDMSDAIKCAIWAMENDGDMKVIDISGFKDSVKTAISCMREQIKEPCEMCNGEEFHDKEQQTTIQIKGNIMSVYGGSGYGLLA